MFLKIIISLKPFWAQTITIEFFNTKNRLLISLPKMSYQNLLSKNCYRKKWLYIFCMKKIKK